MSALQPVDGYRHEGIQKRCGQEIDGRVILQPHKSAGPVWQAAADGQLKGLVGSGLRCVADGYLGSGGVKAADRGRFVRGVVIHTFRDGQGGHILHQGPDGGNIGDVGAVAAPCGDTLALLGRQYGNGTVGPLLPFRSLDGDGQQALLRQFRQLWQFHHVVNRPAQELIEGVGENVGGGFVTVEPDIVAVAVGGGAAKEQGGLSLGGGGGKGGIGLVEASVFQRDADRYALLGPPTAL